MEDAAPKREEVRGPFEPLVPSSGPPPHTARQQPATPDGPDAVAAAGQARTEQRQAGTEQRQAGTEQRQAGTEQRQAGTERRQAPPDAARDDTVQARARKLEQIKDFYMTAVAIGEQNVDKHFDQLLAQQRKLISEYFRQSAAARPARASPRDGLAAEAGAQQHDPRDPPAPEGPPAPPAPEGPPAPPAPEGPPAPERPGATGGQAGPPEGAGVAAEHPRAW